KRRRMDPPPQCAEGFHTWVAAASSCAAAGRTVRAAARPEVDLTATLRAPGVLASYHRPISKDPSLHNDERAQKNRGTFPTHKRGKHEPPPMASRWSSSPRIQPLRR